MLDFGDLEIAVLLIFAIALMHYAQLIKKNSKAIKWLFGGAISFIIASVFYLVEYVAVWVTVYPINYGHALFSIIAWLMVFVGGLKMLYELFAE